MIYLIDFENVHEDGFSVIGHLQEKDAVYCFFTRNVAKISMSCLSGMHNGQLHFIEAESGKQSLDLALVSFLGYLIGSRPHELDFEIISNDNGFTKAADFWNKYGGGVRVIIRKTGTQKTETLKAKTVSPAGRKDDRTEDQNRNQGTADTARQEAVQIQNMQAGSARRQRRRSAKQSEKPAEAAAQQNSVPEEAVPQEISRDNPDSSEAETTDSAVPQEELPAENEKKVDAELASALEKAGIDSGAAEYLLAQIDRYSGDKNMKQLVYRSVVKKFGQKSGTQIYNTAKKLLMK